LLQSRFSLARVTHDRTDEGKISSPADFCGGGGMPCGVMRGGLDRYPA
jgi:hypothetical protein